MLRAIFYANFLCHQMKVSSISPPRFFICCSKMFQAVGGKRKKKKVSRITRMLEIMQCNK